MDDAAFNLRSQPPFHAATCLAALVILIAAAITPGCASPPAPPVLTKLQSLNAAWPKPPAPSPSKDPYEQWTREKLTLVDSTLSAADVHDAALLLSDSSEPAVAARRDAGLSDTFAADIRSTLFWKSCTAADRPVVIALLAGGGQDHIAVRIEFGVACHFPGLDPRGLIAIFEEAHARASEARVRQALRDALRAAFWPTTRDAPTFAACITAAHEWINEHPGHKTVDWRYTADFDPLDTPEQGWAPLYAAK